jgi:hypothetical protein
MFEFSVHVTHLNERVDCHDCHVWLRFCVVHEIQIHELLKLQIVGLHAVDDVGEESGHIFSDSHACNDLLDGFLFLFFLVIVELRLQLEDFTLFGGCKVFTVRHSVIWLELTEPKMRKEPILDFAAVKNMNCQL